MVHFSSRCKTFSSHDGLCSECKNLLKAHTIKKQQKEKRATIHPHCNKKYLSKEELKVALQSKKCARLNAQQREHHWQEKCASEAVQLEDDDHGDLVAMLTTVPKERVPEDMLCLREQQKKPSVQKVNMDTHYWRVPCEMYVK